MISGVWEPQAWEAKAWEPQTWELVSALVTTTALVHPHITRIPKVVAP